MFTAALVAAGDEAASGASPTGTGIDDLVWGRNTISETSRIGIGKYL